MRWRWLVVLVLVLAGADDVTAQSVYLAFGDSITLGVGETDETETGYPTRLKRLLVADGVVEPRVENHGVSGETTSVGLSRIDSVLQKGGDFILIMEGTNDIFDNEISVESTSFNLGKMVDKSRSAGVTPILASVIPLRPSVQTMRDLSLAKSLRQKVLAEDVDFADNYAVFDYYPNAWPDLYNLDRKPDNVGHPNGAGYDVLAESFADVLQGRDSLPPVLGGVKPADGASGVGKTATVSVVVFDHGAGIDLVNSRMLINDSPVTAERSGSKFKSTYTYTPAEPFVGVVTVSMDLRDQAVPSNTEVVTAITFSVVGTTFIKGDINTDGRVDGHDLVELAYSFGKKKGDGRYLTKNDLDRNNRVDGADLAILANNFGKSSL